MTQRKKFSDLEEKFSILGNEVVPLAYLGRNYRLRLRALRDYIRIDIPSSIRIEEVLSELPTEDIVEGVPYAIGPVTVDGVEQYELYIYYEGKGWTNMGYLNSSSLSLTDELGDSKTMAMSQYGVTQALQPIVMTQDEYDALVESGAITDDDTTIRYIVE